MIPSALISLLRIYFPTSDAPWTAGYPNPFCLVKQAGHLLKESSQLQLSLRQPRCFVQLKASLKWRHVKNSPAPLLTGRFHQRNKIQQWAIVSAGCLLRFEVLLLHVFQEYPCGMHRKMPLQMPASGRVPAGPFFGTCFLYPQSEPHESPQ